MKLNKNIAISESGFIFNPTTGDSFSLNEVGLEILELLKEEKTIDQITTHFTNQYEIDASSFEKYFYDFVGMLKHYQLIDEDEENQG
jgi:hypothetical protein